MNIVLIDDHQLLTKSLANILGNYDFIKNIELFNSAVSFLESKSNNKPDVVVSDILMPDMNGIDMLKEFRKRELDFKVLILSSVTEIQTIRYMIRNGATGYLSKDSSPEEVVEAIKSVYNDEPYIGESLRKVLIKTTLIEDQFIYNLSPREKEVLNHVCSGKTIKEAAREMNLSSNTIQTYYKTILKKFNLTRTADLIVFSMQNGLYNPKRKIDK